MALATGSGVVDESADTGSWITFDREPGSYRHWRMEVDGNVATLRMSVDVDGGLRSGDYQLKLNSYDLGVDVELYDAVQRLRFEHPEVRAVVLTSALERIFCAGANIHMLATSDHHHKVNFCKFTNETRNAIEEASRCSGQRWIAALNGTASGGGYELALAAEEILLVDDRSSAVSLPELPLLAVLPGTGGLTRVVDKRGVRRDLADAFATRAEGVRGEQAVAWGLVDHIAPKSRFEDLVAERAAAAVAASDRPDVGPGVAWTPLRRTVTGSGIAYDHVEAVFDRQLGAVVVTVTVPEGSPPADAAGIVAAGVDFWPLAVARELDDLLLTLRFNVPDLGTLVLRAHGSATAVLAVDELLSTHAGHWLVREIRLYLKRTLKRLDLTARSIFALVEPGTCFVGTLAELLLASDRSYMLAGSRPGSDDVATIALGAANDGWYPMSHDATRLQNRFCGDEAAVESARAAMGRPLAAEEAVALGLVTVALDELDWDDEVRVALEERASFSPDALTGLEANCRFTGPETMESKIFARLSAWQNWIFQRPNAAGPDGALCRYGTGTRPDFDATRI